MPDSNANASAVIQTLHDRARLYRLDDAVRAAVAKHAAFRSFELDHLHRRPAQGSGKSFTRRQLAKKLGSLRIQTQETYRLRVAYRDFLHGSINLSPSRGMGLKLDHEGAFMVSEENYLQPGA